MQEPMQESVQDVQEAAVGAAAEQQPAAPPEPEAGTAGEPTRCVASRAPEYILFQFHGVHPPKQICMFLNEQL